MDTPFRISTPHEDKGVAKSSAARGGVKTGQKNIPIESLLPDRVRQQLQPNMIRWVMGYLTPQKE